MKSSIIRFITISGFASAIILAGNVPVFAAEGALSPEKAVEVISETKGLCLLDVRTKAEYDETHLDGAFLIPVQELASRAGELPEGRPILIYCRSGKRAEKAAGMLKTLRPDLTEVMYIKGFPIYGK